MKKISISQELLTGLFLLLATVTALLWANSGSSASYYAFLETDLGIEIASFGLYQNVHEWVNDGLMALFFFAVGLEIKGELVGGELNSFRKALLPVGAAVGGMIIPVGIYIVFNYNGDTGNGWGIPMATDIAFAIVLLSFFKSRVSTSLVVFLTALAIVDDLGSIIVIALFYSSETDSFSLVIGLASFLILVFGNRLGIRSPYFYLLIGIIGLWYFFFRSGVHATLAGVLIALAIPARTKIDGRAFAENARVLLNRFINSCPSGSVLLSTEQVELMENVRNEIRKAETPLQHWKNRITPLVNFVVLPLFALVNAGISIDTNSFVQVLSPVGLGVFFALWLGKPIGILLAVLLMTQIGISKFPDGISWKQMIGAATLAGIGFTVSLFISELAFTEEAMINGSKFAVLLASSMAGITSVFLFSGIKKKT